MQKPLEQYLETVRAGLKQLPSEEREKEITELRQHLDALVLAGCESGETETVAIAQAVAQFGQASTVRRRLLVAYRRRRLAAFRQSWLGAFLLTVCVYYLGIFFGVLLDYFVPWETQGDLTFLLWCIGGKMLLVCWLCGWLSSRLCGWRCLPLIASWTAISFFTKIAPQLPQLWLEETPLAIRIHTLVVDATFVVVPLLSAFIAQRPSNNFRKI